jgi:Uncharacterized protein conserved in bacteria (DUF2188)
MRGDVHVTFRDDQRMWAVVTEGASRASSLHRSRDAAAKAGRERAKANRGELLIHLKDGAIVERNTYRRDPFLPGARSSHSFAFVLDTAGQVTDEVLEQVLEGCDDALVGGREHEAIVEFDREAASFLEAVESALEQIEPVSGLHVRRVEQEELVSLSAIAARVDRSVESVQLLAEGREGPGGFPLPVAWVGAETGLWEWPAVESWWHEHISAEDAVLAHNAQFLAALNDALDMRARAKLLDEGERRIVAEVVRLAEIA